MLPVFLLLCVAGGVWGSTPGVWGYGRIQERQGPAAPLCPSPCQCEEDGIFVMVDCSELGLSSVPTNLSPLTTYLDLSMNNISKIQPRAFHRLHLLSELTSARPIEIVTTGKVAVEMVPGDQLVQLRKLKRRISGNQLRYISGHVLQGLHNLKVLRLDANLLSEVPAGAFRGVRSLRHLWLDDNSLTEIPVTALDSLPSLQAMTLALNQITHIPDYAFTNLSALVVLGFHNNNIKAIPERAFVGNPQLQTIHFYENPIQFVGKSAFQFLPKLHTLDLTENHLSSVPVAGLGGLTHLKLRGNTELYEAFSPDHFPRMRVVEMPYAYQCCVYGSCDSYKPTSQWDTEQSNTDEDLHKRTVAMYPIHADTHYDPDLEEFQLEIEESKLQTSVQCTPTPGPFRPCDSLLGSWLVRVGLWSISLVSLLGNSLLLLSLFGSPGYLSPLRFTVACMGASNLLTGVCTCTLALVDALTLGEFGHHGARWEGGPGCQATGWVWVFASEASVLLLTLAAVQCGVSVTCARAYGKSPSLGSVRTCALFCLTLSLTFASLPLVGVGEYGSSPFCLPSPLPPPTTRLPSSLGFPLALIMMNTLCLLIVTGSYIRLYWELLRGECEGLWDCAMIKHVAWLIFTNGLLYVPVAFLSLCSLLGLLSLGEEVLKSVLLLLQPLPACLNPLLFLLFTRDHSQFFFWPHPKARPQLRRDRTLDSLVSVETEKSSCSDSSTQVSLADPDALYSGAPPLQPRLDPIRFSHCSSTSSVPLIPCQIPTPTARDRDRVTERGSLNDDECLKSLDQDVIHNTLYHSTMTPSLTSHP
ncbi:Leucine-rich repeat-containing G-protein coupled receptor 6 [Collichthys lucidus]|uniref:Leucine-rich repeat-containing G-protein coupled receptor 6 n=1 Tax=Collichthys lucidus TaxID=240159 RepID=A0A4U5URX5_COLLU|nr:Leucine-rich repeat-containing G-protein coupled receptor 6 [Collichthys lucidus]